MSAYKKIECTIIDKDSLLEALDFLELEYSEHDDPKNLTGYMNDIRNDLANIIISKESLNLKYTGASNDIGFLWNEVEQKYEFICSEYDKRKNMDARIIQAYAKIVIEKALVKNGYKTTIIITDDLSRRRAIEDIEIVAKKLI